MAYYVEGYNVTRVLADKHITDNDIHGYFLRRITSYCECLHYNWNMNGMHRKMSSIKDGLTISNIG